MVLLEAKVVDSTHLELAKPIAARRGLTVLVSVTETIVKDAERQEWLAASARSLRGAYADSEPEYPTAMVRESNPDYGG